jgi:superfamily II DNA or RNA helicase
MSLTLRPDQHAWLSAIAQAFKQGANAVLGQAGTGFGKGHCAAATLTSLERKGLRSAFVVHLEEIVLDFVTRLRAFGATSIRVIMGDHSEGPEDAAITVLSVQTLDRRDLTLQGIHYFWWDECHRCASASYRRAKARHPHARHIGSTATPARADGRPLTFFDTLVPGPQVRELVASGALAPLTLYAPDEATDDLSEDPVTIYPAGTPGVVFASSLDHSRTLAARLSAERGLRAQHVEAGTPGRSDIIAAFNAGAIDVLVCYRLICEGVDVPRASACVLAGKMTSAVAFLQGIGRVRRPQGGRARVWDLCGSFWLHGHPDADRSYSLQGRQGITAFNGKDWATPTQCPGCFSWGPPGPCDVCGFLRPPPKPPRISKRALREQRLDALPRTGPEYELWSSLVQTGRERGWKPQAAAIQFREQTGHYPMWGVKQVPERTGEGGTNA